RLGRYRPVGGVQRSGGGEGRMTGQHDSPIVCRPAGQAGGPTIGPGLPRSFLFGAYLIVRVARALPVWGQTSFAGIVVPPGQPPLKPEPCTSNCEMLAKPASKPGWTFVEIRLLPVADEGPHSRWYGPELALPNI